MEAVLLPRIPLSKSAPETSFDPLASALRPIPFSAITVLSIVEYLYASAI